MREYANALARIDMDATSRLATSMGRDRRGAGEAGVLKNVKIRKDNLLEYIYIEADDSGHKLRGIITLGNPRHLKSLHHTITGDGYLCSLE